MRSHLALHVSAAFAFVAIPIAVACGGEIAPGESTSTTKPTPTPTPTSTPTATTTSLPTPPSQPTAVCDSKGLSELDGSTCAVSFQKTIFGKYMSAAGTWSCADVNCHGAQGSAGISMNAPTIGPDAFSAYAALAQFNAISGEPYINACSNDPSQSAFDCNLVGACAPTMPMTGAGVTPSSPTPAEINDVETWLRCGAPFN